MRRSCSQKDSFTWKGRATCHIGHRSSGACTQQANKLMGAGSDAGASMDKPHLLLPQQALEHSAGHAGLQITR